jgi:hypothetical protein
MHCSKMSNCNADQPFMAYFSKMYFFGYYPKCFSLRGMKLNPCSRKCQHVLLRCGNYGSAGCYGIILKMCFGRYQVRFFFRGIVKQTNVVESANMRHKRCQIEIRINWIYGLFLKMHAGRYQEVKLSLRNCETMYSRRLPNIHCSNMSRIAIRTGCYGIILKEITATFVRYQEDSFFFRGCRGRLMLSKVF